jgi:hypothetical protein
MMGTYFLKSGLMRMLWQGHGEVQLDPSELERLAAWIDCNVVFRGSYDRRDD